MLPENHKPGFTGEPSAVFTRTSCVATAIACWYGVLDLIEEKTTDRMAPMNSRNRTSNPSTIETTIQAIFLGDGRRVGAGETPAYGPGAGPGGGGTLLMPGDCTMATRQATRAY